MTDAAFDESVRVLAPEFLGIGCGVRMRCAVYITFKGDCGHVDDRSVGEPLFQIVIFRLTFSQAEPPAVIMNHDVDMIRVVEGRRAAIECGIIEIPLRRSDLPNELSKIVPVFIVARPPALRRLDPGEIDFRFGDVVEIIDEDIESYMSDDFGRLPRSESRVGQGLEIDIVNSASFPDDDVGKPKCGRVSVLLRMPLQRGAGLLFVVPVTVSSLKRIPISLMPRWVSYPTCPVQSCQRDMHRRRSPTQVVKYQTRKSFRLFWLN